MGSSFLRSRLPAVVAAVLDVQFLAPGDADDGGGARRRGRREQGPPRISPWSTPFTGADFRRPLLVVVPEYGGRGQQGGGVVGLVVGVDEDVLSRFRWYWPVGE